MIDLACGLAATLVAAALQTSPGEVCAQQKISETSGGLGVTLADNELFGKALARLGDLDGDGVVDLAVGATGNNDGGGSRGAVYVLFLEPDGTVASHGKISSTSGGFTGGLDNGDRFGGSLAHLGDLDGDGVVDLAVGAYRDDDGGAGLAVERGAAWILFLHADGTVKSHAKISDTAGGFTGALDDSDFFGRSVAAIDDLDGDGVVELAVGASGDDDGSVGDGSPGAVWILFLRADGTVKAHQKISATEGGFTGALDPGDEFGFACRSPGDLDGDGLADLAVGAFRDDDGGINRGAVWILFLRADGTVREHTKISDTAGGFTGTLHDADAFGFSFAPLGDFDGDGRPDLATGGFSVDGGGVNRGALWLLFLDADGSVLRHHAIGDMQGGFTGTLADGDFFGTSLSLLGDVDGDGVDDLAVGADRVDDGGDDHGSVWMLFLNGSEWTMLPGGVGGALGTPQLSGSGKLVDGSPIALELSGALPSSTAWLVVGVAQIGAPFKGGLLVPDPTPPGFSVPLPTGPAGAIAIAGTWPAGVPRGFSLYLQAWVSDASGPAGFSASDGLSATTPP